MRLFLYSYLLNFTVLCLIPVQKAKKVAHLDVFVLSGKSLLFRLCRSGSSVS